MSLSKKQVARLYDIARDDLNRANSYYDSEIQPVLQERYNIYRADRDYYTEKYPNLSEQSKLVSYDMWSTVEYFIPTLMASFFGNNRVVSIEGREGEDIDAGRKFQKLIDWQIMNRNKGFLVFQNWFKQGISTELGIVKCWWNRELEWEEVDEYMPIESLQNLLAEENVEIISTSSEPDEWGDYKVTYRTSNVLQNHPQIELVKADDLRWNPEARSIEEATFVAQRKRVNGDHLQKMANLGIYNKKDVKKALKSERSSSYSEIETDRNPGISERPHEEDNARAQYELWECYLQVDADQDGLLENRVVTFCNDIPLRQNLNKYDRAPFFTLSANHDPYTLFPTLGLTDIVGEMQDLKTVMMRQVSVNLSLNNNPRTFIDETKVNVNDLLTNRQHIRVRGVPQQAVYSQPIQPIASWTMPFFEYIETQLEQWTGKTRYNQGLDADSLNKTATGMSLIFKASTARLGQLVRVFAETGVGELYRYLIKLNQMYLDQTQVFRLMNERINVTPDDISGNFDLEVSVETGITDRQQEVQNLQNYLSVLWPQGAQAGAVDPASSWRNAVSRLMESMEIKNPQELIPMPRGGAWNDGGGGMNAGAGTPGSSPQGGGQGAGGNPLKGLPPSIAGQIGGGGSARPFINQTDGR